MYECYYVNIIIIILNLLDRLLNASTSSTEHVILIVILKNVHTDWKKLSEIKSMNWKHQKKWTKLYYDLRFLTFESVDGYFNLMI